ncbi:MAG: GntR family transcriptional regulator [Hyphomonadaceae bacterium]|jgi:DNA-binding GntR family transcriptional regulator|nr:GntR family transcriptional regulator [Hyphomonadaceae bacterium]
MTRAQRPLKLGSARKARLRVVRSGLHEEAAKRLRALIIRGDLKPGEQLIEADLCAALGVSRTPLREALKLLAAESLVELRRNRSAIVTPIRREDIDELFEAVAGIERFGAELAAVRMTQREHERLTSLQERMERHHDVGQLQDYFELNQQIHAFILACARNGALKATHDGLMARVERARFFALSSQVRWAESVEEHRAIMQALAARDGETAGRLLGHHVQRTGQVVNNILHGETADARGSDPHRAAGDDMVLPRGIVR